MYTRGIKYLKNVKLDSTSDYVVVSLTNFYFARHHILGKWLECHVTLLSYRRYVISVYNLAEIFNFGYMKSHYYIYKVFEDDNWYGRKKDRHATTTGLISLFCCTLAYYKNYSNLFWINLYIQSQKLSLTFFHLFVFTCL